jgi:hypothetical protein
MTVHTEPWSANAHYHRIVFKALPDNCFRALDVGWVWAHSPEACVHG